MKETAPRRSLTRQESEVLRDVRMFWGPQDLRAKTFFFSKRDEAVLFVKARDGSTSQCVVLTNLAQMRADGLSTWDYRRMIMGPSVNRRSGVWLRVAYAASRLRAFFYGWHREP